MLRHGTHKRCTGAEYQMEVMRCLRVVNVDSNTVGWYTTSILGSFLTTTIETQVSGIAFARYLC